VGNWTQRADGNWRNENDDLNHFLKVTKDESYPIIVESRHDGWPAAGYEWQLTTAKVRRVDTDGRAEVQVELTVEELKGTRLYTKCAGLTLPLPVAEALAKVLAPDLVAALEGIIAEAPDWRRINPQLRAAITAGADALAKAKGA
jgi:hypothetical protein